MLKCFLQFCFYDFKHMIMLDQAMRRFFKKYCLQEQVEWAIDHDVKFYSFSYNRPELLLKV